VAADERARGRRAPRPNGAASRRRAREPRLTRSRTRGVVAATGGLLGVSSTKRAVVLALVVCALALTVAVPLRNYVTQRQELDAVSAREQALAAEVDALTAERARLSDPAEIRAEARRRLGFVMPGEVPYVVELPPGAAGEPVPDPDAGTPWYRVLWREVTEGPR
jgi:cell division protein FtsB